MQEDSIQSTPQLETAAISKVKKRDISPSTYRKCCDICQTPCDVLVRCRIDDTLKWCFVCTSKCWKEVSGGEIDGPDKEYYTYGGMWKNKHAGVSAKKPKKKRSTQITEKFKAWRSCDTGYTTNDKVEYGGTLWVCQRSHKSGEERAPGSGYTYWKEDERNGSGTEARYKNDLNAGEALGP